MTKNLQRRSVFSCFFPSVTHLVGPILMFNMEAFTSVAAQSSSGSVMWVSVSRADVFDATREESWMGAGGFESDSIKNTPAA